MPIAERISHIAAVGLGSIGRSCVSLFLVGIPVNIRRNHLDHD